jgi:hypothetical protein
LEYSALRLTDDNEYFGSYLKHEVDNDMYNLIISCAVLIGMVGCVVIMYLISLFFPNKCFALIQSNLMMFTSIYCFYTGALAFISGANTTQECSILKKAAYGNDTAAQNTVLLWAGINTTNDMTIGLASTCLFYSNMSMNSLLEQYYDPYLFSDEMYMLMLYSNFTSEIYYEQQDLFVPDFVFEFEATITASLANPENESLTDSIQLVKQLNLLTESTAAGCEIHDVWTYNYEDCKDHPRIYGGSSVFMSSYIGKPACLALIYTNESSFDYRYNSSYISACDPSNQIKALYTPLNSYSSSSFKVFNNFTFSYYNPLYYSWQSLANYFRSFNYITTDIDFWAGDSIYYNNLVQNASCLAIQQRLDQVITSVCKWGGGVSVLCFSVMILGLIGVFYAFLRVNYVRYMRNKESSKENMIELAPNAPLMDNYKPQFIAVPVKS